MSGRGRGRGRAWAVVVWGLLGGAGPRWRPSPAPFPAGERGTPRGKREAN